MLDVKDPAVILYPNCYNTLTHQVWLNEGEEGIRKMARVTGIAHDTLMLMAKFAIPLAYELEPQFLEKLPWIRLHAEGVDDETLRQAKDEAAKRLG